MNVSRVAPAQSESDQCEIQPDEQWQSPEGLMYTQDRADDIHREGSGDKYCYGRARQVRDVPTN
ncbi:MAG: hypothetical protein ABSG36_00065 [Acidimicrobiales bacterium]|jgi:DNA topoisomerase IB